MTAAGVFTLAPQTNSVTINGVGAQGYSDGTFAATNSVSLADGNNTFTTSLRNSAGQTLVKTNAQNLPVSVSFTYDYDGNMTGDGVAALVYDDADRLVSVTANRAWRVEYAYDGLWRRRKSYQYGWTGSSWSLTNATIYVYDRMLPIQERSGFNNHVHVTYTRGLDLSAGQAGLSGTFQGAGGIGGLLARTDTNANSTLYFADGAGNITTLINSSGIKQASYLYDPFGNLLSMSGPQAAPNHYRFSSKEIDPLSGDYYFGYRFYSPNLQRWRNADPIGLWGGLNVHRFIYNNPLSWVNPWGEQFFLGPPQSGMVRYHQQGPEPEQATSNLVHFRSDCWTGAQASYDFGEGNWGWGTFNLALAVSDAIPLRSLGDAVGKGLWKTGSHTWDATRKWLTKCKWREFPGQEAHHWAIPRSGWGSFVPDWLKNQPWNLTWMPDRTFHNALHGIGKSRSTLANDCGTARQGGSKLARLRWAEEISISCSVLAALQRRLPTVVCTSSQYHPAMKSTAAVEDLRYPVLCFGRTSPTWSGAQCAQNLLEAGPAQGGVDQATCLRWTLPG